MCLVGVLGKSLEENWLIAYVALFRHVDYFGSKSWHTEEVHAWRVGDIGNKN